MPFNTIMGTTAKLTGSPNCSWTRRRSFLSSTMINDEKHFVYEMNSYYSKSKKIPFFSLSLKESQGFCWNQDLFASEYQQKRAKDEEEANEDEDTETEVKVFEEEVPVVVVRHRRRSSGGNERDGYGGVEMSEIIIKDDLEEKG